MVIGILAYGWGNHASAGYLTSSSTQSKYLRSDTDDTTTGALTIGEGTNQARLIIKKADNDVSDHIALYNGTTRIGEIGAQDDTWLRINQNTNKNIYTPRYIRADSGFFVAYLNNNRIHHAGDFSTTDVSNGVTAYGWGNHASAGYLTSAVTTETNSFLGDGGGANTHPGTNRVIFTGQVSAGSEVLGMPTVDNSNAFLNINRHSGEYNSQLGFSSNGHIYYRKFSAAAINGTQPWLQVYHSGVFTNNSSNWNTAHGWGNHASAGYISSFTDTNEFVTGATFNGSNGIVTFTRNNGGDTFTLNLASTLTDVTVTGGTYTSGTQTLRLTKSDGNTIDVSGFAIDTDTNTNNYTTGATFNTGNGIITGTRNGGATWTVDIDGRFAPTVHNHKFLLGSTANEGGGGMQNWNSQESTLVLNPTTDWYTSLRIGHGDPVAYYSNTLAMSMTGGDTGRIHVRTNGNGTYGTWKKYWHDGDFTTTNISNWNAAYGWGNHASAGYVTGNYLPIGGKAADSELLDGIDSTQFLRSDASDTHTATLTVNGQFIFNSSLNSSYREGIRLNVSTSGWGAAVIGGVRDSISGITDAWWVARNPSKDFVISYGTSANSGGLYLPHNSSALEYKNNRIWNESDFANNSGNWNTAYGWGNHTSGGYATLSGSNSFTNSYNEFGNGTGSVSNDGSWNARVNIAGTSHARLDVKSVSDGIITSIYSHIGNGAGKMGTMSNHPLKLMVNGNDKATLDSGGGFTLIGGLTSASINTGQGATEVHLMNQNVRTNDSPTFSTLNATSLVATSTVSGSTVLDIQGTQGQLFSITDDLTGDLFSVSDSSGVPIFNVNANGTVSIDTLGLLTVGGSITGTSFVKSGGTSSQFLKADGSVDSTTYLSSLPSHTHTFASLTSKPTTLSGYGITDAASSSHTHTFASLTSKPTTLSGYGITDAASSSHNHHGTYMKTNRTLTSINTIDNGGDRYDPSADNPTNEHYAVLTYGNGGNVTGQLATHFVTGDLYSRGYNSSWSTWKKYFNTDDFSMTNVSNWNTAYGWGDHGLSAQDKTDIGNLSGTNTGDQDLSGYLTTTGKAADSEKLDGLDSLAYMRDNGWNTSPGQDADIQPVMSSDFTYGNNAPHTGDLIRFGASGYSLQMSSQYNGTGNGLSFRTRNGDNSTWNPWKTVFHSGIFTNNSTNWNTAYGWGDHSTAGYTGDQDLSGYLPIGGKAADSELLDGIDSGSFMRRDTSMTLTSGSKFTFHSGGGGGTFSANHYQMGKDIANGGWASPHYSDLIIGYHTGIRLGASYSGIRFYNNSPTSDTDNDGIGNGGEGLIMTVGGAAGSTNVLVAGTMLSSNFSGTHSGTSSGTNTGDQTNISGNSATSDYATTAGSASNIDNVGFTNSNSGNAQAADSINNNGISYVSGFPNLSGNASDGALYSQAYSSQWQHQIYGDYRVGGIWVRGKNSNTWQSWKKVALVNSTTFTNVLGVAFTHGLDTKNLVVQVYDTNDNLFFPSDINVTDTEVNIDFAKPRSGRVVVTG